MRYSSAIGNFFFDKNVAPSKAKLIRDTVVGQFLNPKPGAPQITSKASAQEFIRDHPAQVLAVIPFNFEFLV